jgi:hypothetical protein
MPASDDDWHRARALLAARLLAAADARNTSLTVIQRDVLVPLEFDVMSAKAYQSAPQLVIVVLRALTDKDRRRRA